MRRATADGFVAIVGVAFTAEDMLSGLAGEPPGWRLLVGLALLVLSMLPWGRAGK